MTKELRWKDTPGGFSGAHNLLMQGDEYVGHFYVDAHESVDVDEVMRVMVAGPRMLEALRKASQLASIANDWNLCEIGIDGKVVSVHNLQAEIDAAIAKAEGR